MKYFINILLVFFIFAELLFAQPSQETVTQPRVFPVLSALWNRQCNAGVVPANVGSLRAIPGTDRTSVELYFLPSSNRPCAVKYLVSIYEGGSSAGVPPIDTLTSTASPVKILNLKSGVQYTFTVQALTEASGSSGPIATTVTLESMESSQEPGFTCISGGDDYPKCVGAAGGLCKASTCDKLAAMGLCSSPLLKHTDWTARKVTQFCHGNCGCSSSTPSLRSSMAQMRDDLCCDIAAGEYFNGADGLPTAGLL